MRYVLQIKVSYRSSVVQGVLENTSGRYSTGSLHAVADSSCVGEVWELLANIHKLSELRLGGISVLVAYDRIKMSNLNPDFSKMKSPR